MRKNVFIRYSFRYLFFARSGQKLLLLALLGLFLCCFSLLVLQSTMGGLQRNLETRSKEVMGHGEFVLLDQSSEFSHKIQRHLRDAGIENYREYELELLAKRKTYLSPLVIHGVEWRRAGPPHLRGENPGALILGVEAANKLKASATEQLQLISPAHLDPILGGIPRQVTEPLDSVLFTGVAEADLFHGWVRAGLIHNLIQEVSYNKIRHYTAAPQVALDLARRYPQKLRYSSWEQINQTLVKALKLETTVMIVLFVAMTLLVAISIISGLFIFYQKIQRDILGLWILGASERQLSKASLLFVQLLSLATCGLALLVGILFLTALDQWSPVVMPEVFVDRRIPVEITGKRLLISLFIPYTVAAAFSWFCLWAWRRDQQGHLAQLRALS